MEMITLSTILMIVVVSTLAAGLLTLLYKIYSINKANDRFDATFDYRYYHFNRLCEKVEALKKKLIVLQTELIFADHSRSIAKFILALDYLKFEMDGFRANDVAQIVKSGIGNDREIASALYEFENQYNAVARGVNMFMNDINSNAET